MWYTGLMAERHEPNLDRVRDAMREHDENAAAEERDEATREEREPAEDAEDDEES